MSINKLVSIRYPIVDALTQLGMDHDKDIPYFTSLATQAEKKIGSYFQYERTKTVVSINHCIARLPEDCVLVEAAILGSHVENCNDIIRNTCGSSSITTTNLSGNVNFLVIDVGGSIGDNVSIGTVDYVIQGNKLIFPREITQTELTVQYLRYKTDCDGFVEVNENHVEAIKWYIIWMASMRNLTSRGGNYVARDMIALAKSEWERECRAARAEDNRLTQPEKEQAAQIYSNPFSGRSIWQNMYTTLGNRYFIW